jgi:hypothetical protein
MNKDRKKVLLKFDEEILVEQNVTLFAHKTLLLFLQPDLNQQKHTLIIPTDIRYTFFVFILSNV